MQWSLLPALLLIATAASTETASETNEIIPTDSTENKSTQHLRRLVIPIDGAEDSETESNKIENATSKDEILEESTAPDKMSVHFYSANVDMETNTEGDLLKYLLEKVGNPANNESKVIIKFTPTERSVKSVDSETNFSNDIPSISAKGETSTTAKTNEAKSANATANEVTTTSKPAPTHNEDGENIEVVDKKDIKILEAPLVSAFTVHQDDVGLPKKVVPLIAPLQPTPVPVVQLSSINFPPRNSFVQSELIKSNPISTESPLGNAQPIPIQLPVPSFLRPEALQKHYAEIQAPFIPQNTAAKTQISSPVSPQVHQPARDLLPPISNSPNQPIQPQQIQQIQPSLQLQQFQPTQQNLPNFAAFSQQNALLQNQQQQLNLQQLLLERQKYLEEQIFILQNQAQQQQQQLLLQQQLLQDSRRKRYENQSGQPNQLIPNKSILNKSKLQNEIFGVNPKPQLEIIPSVTQSPRYEVSTQQHLPVRDATPFHNNPASFVQQSPKSSNVDIQASTQLNFNQQQTNIPTPLELSSTLQLPQRANQQFRTNFNQNAGVQIQQQQLIQQQLLQQQQQQQQQQLLQRQQQQLLQQQILQQQQQQQQVSRNRNFRSELQTGNLGLNLIAHSQPKFIPQQSFVPQTPSADVHLQSLLYQSGISNPKSNDELNVITKVLALNHGINPHIPQNLQIPWPFGSF